MLREITSLKLARSAVNAHDIIWDVMYILKEEDRDIIPRMSDYSLVVPMYPTLRDALISELKTNKPPLTHHNMLRRDLRTETYLPEELVPEQCLAVIPILLKYNSSIKRYNPAYLSGKRHMDAATSAYVRAAKFPSKAWIQTPQRIIQPLCLACSLGMRNMTGSCNPGSFQCYAHLVFDNPYSFRSRYKQGVMEIPEDFKNLEEEIKNSGVSMQSAVAVGGES